MGCRCCISKWCDQINDRLAPKALKKFSSCFPFCLFGILYFVYCTSLTIDSARDQRSSYPDPDARTAAAAVGGSAACSQLWGAPWDCLPFQAPFNCVEKRVHSLLGSAEEGERKLQAWNFRFFFNCCSQVASYKSLSSYKKITRARAHFHCIEWRLGKFNSSSSFSSGSSDSSLLTDNLAHSPSLGHTARLMILCGVCLIVQLFYGN